MANNRIHALLNLDNAEAQRSWFLQHAPAQDNAILTLLEEEAQRRWRTDPQTAFSIARVVSTAAAVWSDQETVAAALHMEANTYWFLSEHRTALALYRTAVNLYDSLGLDLKVAHVAVGQLNAMMYLGQYEPALQLAEQAGKTFRKYNDQLALGKMIMNRGNILFRLGRYREALASYDEAETIFSALADLDHLAMVSVNAASVHMMLDDFAQAEHILQQARATFAAEEMRGVLALVDHNLAELLFYQGQYQEALHQFNQARQAFVALDQTVDVAYVDLYRSDVYLALNLWREALELAQSARRPFLDADMAWESGRLWLNEAVALAHLPDGRSPELALKQARQIFAGENNAFWLAATDLYEATFALHQNDLALAQQRAEQAVDTFRRARLPGRIAQCLNILGDVALRQKQPQIAAGRFQQALDALGQVDMPAIIYACYYGLGQVAMLQDDTKQARDYYRKSIRAIERLQAAISAEDYKIAFLSDKLRVYDAHISLCLEAGSEADLKEAFATVELAKSRALLDVLAQTLPITFKENATAEFLEELERLKRELNWYYNRLHGGQPDRGERSVQQMQILTTAVAQREQALGKLLRRQRAAGQPATSGPIWTVSVEEVQKVLPANSLLLEFYVSECTIVVFGVSARTIWRRHLSVTGKIIADVLGQLRFQMNKFGYGRAYSDRYADSLLESANDALYRLFQFLIAPIAHRLTTDTLLIVPHGLLHYVPFHALFDGDKYLLDDKMISYAPSATILYHLLSPTDQIHYDAPVVAGLSDTAIPFAQNEAESIAHMFPGTRVWLGQEATLANVTADLSRASCLHLSTHATFRSDNPLFSALKLADGWLCVNDFYAMESVPPLVTLSACETGRHQVMVGDELMGLCRGIFAGGAHSIVVSLWMVEDASTAQFMTHFYASLRRGEPIHRALRSAQLATKSEKPHPYFWAPFILTGATRNPLAPDRNPVTNGNPPQGVARMQSIDHKEKENHVHG